SVLVDATGKVRAEERNRAHTDNATRHPEFDLARWAGRHLTAEERREATVYTSGEHCPMCSTAHGVVGLGRIVFASSGKQLQEWHDELGVAPPAARFRPVVDMLPHAEVSGPFPEFTERIRALHFRYHQAE